MFSISKAACSCQSSFRSSLSRFSGSHGFPAVGNRAASSFLTGLTVKRIFGSPKLLYGGSLVIGGTLYYYSLDYRDRRKLRNTAQGFQRFTRTIWNGLRIGVDYKWNLRGISEESPEYDDVLSQIHYRAAKRILDTCLKNGGVYIKMGQALSAGAQANFIPKEYAEVLMVLQDKALTMRPDELDELFLEDFGAYPEKFFSFLNRTPIAAASLAQVFKATTHDGREVAVKCQYLDLQDRHSGDLRAVQLVLGMVKLLFPNFIFAFVFDEIKESLVKELDFINEGRNSERCAKELRHLPFLHIPTVYWDLCSPRVLTTEFISDAAKITEVKKIESMGLSIKDVSRKMLTIFGEQIFGTGFVHADPHPGNIFVRKDAYNDAQIVLLDHGLYQYIPEDVRAAVCGVYKAAVLGDHAKMKAYSDQLKMPDYKMFAGALVQRMIGPSGTLLLGMKRDLTKEEMERFRVEMEDQIEMFVKTVRAMPKSLYLVLRNMNLVRTICIVHGNPVDRYTVFARIAAREVAMGPGGALETQGIIEGMAERLEFEFMLLWHRASFWVFALMVRILILFGIVPDFSNHPRSKELQKIGQKKALEAMKT